MSAIKIENLTKIYRRSHLGRLYTSLGVKNISLEVKENEVFGLLGLNGSGKTTTIKLVLGLLSPTTGEISLFGQKNSDRKILSKLGYLPESPYFQRYLTGREVLEFYCRLSGIEDTKGRIREVLEMVQLDKHAGKRTSEFSKGMLQRLGIAQSLLHNPPLLIFDEPAGGLDPLGIREIRNFITMFKAAGKTVFFSSHMISEVEKICDRVAILHRGELKAVLMRADWAGKPLEEIFIGIVEQNEGNSGD